MNDKLVSLLEPFVGCTSHVIAFLCFEVRGSDSWWCGGSHFHRVDVATAAHRARRFIHRNVLLISKESFVWLGGEGGGGVSGGRRKGKRTFGSEISGVFIKALLRRSRLLGRRLKVRGGRNRDNAVLDADTRTVPVARRGATLPSSTSSSSAASSSLSPSASVFKRRIFQWWVLKISARNLQARRYGVSCHPDSRCQGRQFGAHPPYPPSVCPLSSPRMSHPSS